MDDHGNCITTRDSTWSFSFSSTSTSDRCFTLEKMKILHNILTSWKLHNVIRCTSIQDLWISCTSLPVHFKRFKPKRPVKDTRLHDLTLWARGLRRENEIQLVNWETSPSDKTLFTISLDGSLWPNPQMVHHCACQSHRRKNTRRRFRFVFNLQGVTQTIIWQITLLTLITATSPLAADRPSWRWSSKWSK